jgi:methylmalonyl-CoA mutase
MKKSRDLNETLFEPFSIPSRSDWKSVASSEVGGEDALKKLTWTSKDDQKFLPIYSSEDIRELKSSIAFRLGSDLCARAWANMPEVQVTDEIEGNEIALQHLKNESEGAIFRVTEKTVNLPTLLKGIEWEHCSISFISENVGFNQTLETFIKESRYDARLISGAIFSRDPQHLPWTATSFRSLGITIDESTPVQEISVALMKGVKIIDQYIRTGGKAADAISRIAFLFPLGPDLITEVTKLKAIRRLWFQVVKAYGVNDCSFEDLYLHGYSAPWVNEKFQPHGNMLKSTISAIAGIAGGCNAITIRPEDSGNNMMARIARNTSHILLEESYLGKVSDPFAGSYAVEAITDELARKAWDRFQTML